MKRHGFTLIELFVVMAIIAILAGMLLSGLFAVQQAAKRQYTQVILAKVDSAIRQFHTDNQFYPRGMAGNYPLFFQKNVMGSSALTSDPDQFFDIKTDPLTGVPVPDNDTEWKDGTTPWKEGNGLFARLGVAMTAAEETQAKANAAVLRRIANERTYHFGDFCKSTIYWGQGTSYTTTDSTFAYDDPVPYVAANATTGERELKKILDHFQCGPSHFYAPGWEWGWTGPSNYSMMHLNEIPMRYLAYIRPRDCKDEYLRALRNGVPAEAHTFDSHFDSSNVAVGWNTTNRTISTTALSKPWSEAYIVDLEPRYHRDVDGDTHEDVIDAYGQPLIYINEGLPAADRIFPRQASVWRRTSDFINSYESYGGTATNGTLVHYHPDPDADAAGWFTGARAQFWLTDKVNSRGVTVAADAFDRSHLEPNFGSLWIYNQYNCNPLDVGEPYAIAGTAVPSRVRVSSVPTTSRGGEIYYCLSEDGGTLVEPYTDTDASGTYTPGEIYIDRNYNGSHDSSGIADNDIRLCAPSGGEREYELLSAGRDGRFHALRGHQANADNIKSQGKR